MLPADKTTAGIIFLPGWSLAKSVSVRRSYRYFIILMIISRIYVLLKRKNTQYAIMKGMIHNGG
jgi:hypothetical protein